HALLPWEAEPALADQLDPVAGEPHLLDAVAGGGTDRCAHVVRVLGVDQHNRWRTSISLVYRPDLDTHPVSVRRNPVRINQIPRVDNSVRPAGRLGTRPGGGLGTQDRRLWKIDPRQ